jgi:hypothetical protein
VTSYTDIMLGRLFAAKGHVPVSVVSQCLASTSEQRTLADVLVVRGLITSRAAKHMQRIVAHMQFMRGEMLFARLAVQRQLATPQAVQAALEQQKQGAYRERIGQILVQRGLLRPDHMEALVDEQLMTLAEDAMRIEAEGLTGAATPQQAIAELAAPPASGPPSAQGRSESPTLAGAAPPQGAPPPGGFKAPPLVWPGQERGAQPQAAPAPRPAARAPIKATEEFAIPLIPDDEEEAEKATETVRVPAAPPDYKPSTAEMAAAMLDSAFDVVPLIPTDKDTQDGIPIPGGEWLEATPERTMFVDSGALAAQPFRGPQPEADAEAEGVDAFSPEHTLPVDSASFAAKLPTFKQTDAGLDLAEATAELRRPLAPAAQEPELRPERILRAFDSSLLISGVDGMLERHSPRAGQAESKPIRVVPQREPGVFKAPLVPKVSNLDHFQLSDGSIWRVFSADVFTVKGVECYQQLCCEDVGELEQGLHQSWDGKIPGLNG